MKGSTNTFIALLLTLLTLFLVCAVVTPALFFFIVIDTSKHFPNVLLSYWFDLFLTVEYLFSGNPDKTIEPRFVNWQRKKISSLKRGKRTITIFNSSSRLVAGRKSCRWNECNFNCSKHFSRNRRFENMTVNQSNGSFSSRPSLTASRCFPRIHDTDADSENWKSHSPWLLD